MGAREKILFTLALAMAMGFIGYTLLGPGGGKQAQLQFELTKLQQENGSLRAENKQLAAEVEALKKRGAYLEKVARDELGLVKPDELIIQLPNQPASDDRGADP